VHFDFLYNFYPKHFSSKEELSEIWLKMYSGLHVKYPLFLLDFKETLIFLTDFEKYSNMKFQENPSNGSWDVPCQQMDRHDEANSRYPQFCERA